jgi:hypothetical protein
MDFKKLKVTELQAKLKSLNLPYYGKKSDLIQRLNKHHGSENIADTSEELLSMDEDQIEEIPSQSSQAIQQISNQKRGRDAGKSYLFEACFHSKDDAIDFIDNEDVWSKADKRETKHGVKRFYKCKFRKSSNCYASLCLLYHATDSNVTLSRSIVQHNDHKEPSRGIPEAIKQQIKALYEQKITQPKSIQESLEKSFPKTFPDIIQIYNFLAEYRKELYGEHEFDIGQLRKWCDKYSINETNTTEDDEIIVQSSISIESEDNAKFYVFVSTKRLLENCRKTEHICADATYKLTYEGFPVLLCGTTDKC